MIGVKSLECPDSAC